MKEEKTQDKKFLIEYTDYELDAMGNVIKYTEISRGKPSTSTREITYF